MKKLFKTIVVLIASVDFVAAAILIAPPPLTYSPLNEVGNKTSAQFNYLSFDTDTSSTTGYGVGVSHRIKKTAEEFHNFSLSYMNMTGDSTVTTTESETNAYNLSYMYGLRLKPQLQGFVGATINFSAFSSEVPMGSSSGSDLYVDTLMYSAAAGVQYEHEVEFGVIIPWAALAYIAGGSSDIETISYGAGATTTESTADIDSFAAYQLGFDVYFSAIATSLSTMYQSSDDADSLSLSASYNF